MRKKCLKVLGKLYEFIDDIILIISIYFISRGIFLIYVPAGYIALGICLLALAFFIARKKVIADAYTKLNG